MITSVRLENPGSGSGAGSSTPVYTHGDHLGSAVAATDAAGAVLWREQYTPYGEKLENPAANDNNTGYTGHLEDAATDLTYMQARYFDPIIGRFLSTDPIGYQDQLNLYAYVHNDPVNATDPTGMCSGEHCPWGYTRSQMQAFDSYRNRPKDIAGVIAVGVTYSRMITDNRGRRSVVQATGGGLQLVLGKMVLEQHSSYRAKMGSATRTVGVVSLGFMMAIPETLKASSRQLVARV